MSLTGKSPGNGLTTSTAMDPYHIKVMPKLQSHQQKRLSNLHLYQHPWLIQIIKTSFSILPHLYQHITHILPRRHSKLSPRHQQVNVYWSDLSWTLLSRSLKPHWQSLFPLLRRTKMDGPVKLNRSSRIGLQLSPHLHIILDLPLPLLRVRVPVMDTGVLISIVTTGIMIALHHPSTRSMPLLHTDRNMEIPVWKTMVMDEAITVRRIPPVRGPVIRHQIVAGIPTKSLWKVNKLSFVMNI